MKHFASGVAFAALLAAASPALAIAGFGTMSCGDWVQARLRSGDQTDIAYSFYVLGFLSGSALQTNEDVLRDVSPNTVQTWVDNYCRTHPLDRLHKAADTLFEELRARKRGDR